MILSSDFSSTCIMSYFFTFIRSFEILIQSDADLISPKKRSLLYVRGPLHSESYMTLLFSEVDFLSTVFAKEKFGVLLFHSAVEVIFSFFRFSFRRVISAIAALSCLYLVASVRIIVWLTRSFDKYAVLQTTWLRHLQLWFLVLSFSILDLKSDNQAHRICMLFSEHQTTH
jgi:hypothetical protein